RELVVSGGFEHRRHVHVCNQSSAVSTCRYHDVVVLSGVVEVGDRAKPVRRLQEREIVVAASAGQRVGAVITDQDVISASAAQRFRAVSGNDDVIAAGADKRGCRGGIVHDGCRCGIAGGLPVGGGVAERTA